MHRQKTIFFQSNAVGRSFTTVKRGRPQTQCTIASVDARQNKLTLSDSHSFIGCNAAAQRQPTGDPISANGQLHGRRHSGLIQMVAG